MKPKALPYVLIVIASTWGFVVGWYGRGTENPDPVHREVRVVIDGEPRWCHVEVGRDIVFSDCRESDDG